MFKITYSSRDCKLAQFIFLSKSATVAVAASGSSTANKEVKALLSIAYVHEKT